MNRRRRPARSRGLTLLEVLAGLAVLAVLATMAMPSLSGLMQGHRLAAAAEALAGDLREARFEAVRSGEPLHLQSQQPGAKAWCWSIARQPGCDCATTPAAGCSLKTVRASDHPGIALLGPLQARLEPQGQAGQVASAELASAQGQRLRVELAALGRSRICVPEQADRAGHARYPHCQAGNTYR